jgi:DNA-binding LacI/PurR family transcriptional regulator
VYRPATLKNVADVAGVSTATVARVLHNRGYVAPDTRQRVEQALQQTGYQINAIAQGLRRQRTYTLGHVLRTIKPNQFCATVAEGVEEIASQNGCGVLMITTDGDQHREFQAVKTLIQRRVDAVIFTTATHVDNVRLAVEARFPVIQVERKTELDTTVVTADNFGGAYAAVEHLLELGHRRIGFIGVDPGRPSVHSWSARYPDVEQERLDGYVSALTNHRVKIDPSLIALEPSYTSNLRGEDAPGYQAMLRFLNHVERPSAVFCSFDLIAASALQVIYQRGLRVPDDISVIGFDDTYAPFLTPPLTAVENPMLQMGWMAARLVFQQLDAGDGTAIEAERRLAMKLNVRASTAAPGAAGRDDPVISDRNVSSMMT